MSLACAPAAGNAASPPATPVEEVSLTVFDSLDKAADRYIVRFSEDGIVELDGTFKGKSGHYVGPLRFSEVAAIVDAENLCDQTGVSHLTLATPSAPPSGAKTFFLRVRCDGRSKSFRTSNPAAAAVVAGLTAFVDRQYLRRAGDSQIDQRILLDQ